jgi:uncharacterized protein (TIGR03437 family)
MKLSSLSTNRISLLVSILTLAIAMTIFARLNLIPKEVGGSARGIRAPQAVRHRVSESYSGLPLAFEVNRGQADDQIKFLARGANYSFLFASTEATLHLDDDGDPTNQPATVRMKFVGASPQVQIAGLDELPGKSNYLIGNDQKRWRTNVPNYAKVRYREVYPGVDLIFYGNQRRLEYDFVVVPGADPCIIKLRFAGVSESDIDTRGDLILKTSAGEIRQNRPFIYQEIGLERRAIEGRYRLLGGNMIGFQIGDYDPSLPLVIDPALVYSTYLGGSESDVGYGIAVDSSGSVYVTGFTASKGAPDFPVSSGAFQTPVTRNGCTGYFIDCKDVFVTKFNPSGTAVVYSTFFGGSKDDRGHGIAIDSSGNAYVTGETNSADFPFTPDAVQKNFICDDRSDTNPCRDAFVVKLNAAGSALIYSTFLGDRELDTGNSIAVDSSGNAFVTGSTASSAFPVTTNAFQRSLAGMCPCEDAFITKLNSAGSALIYSTFLGGRGYDRGHDITIDATGNAYIAGITTRNGNFGDDSPSDFPMTPDAFQTIYGGDSTFSWGDAFITKLNRDGTSLLYSTLLGGKAMDSITSVAVDSSGGIYVAGRTDSTNFPVTRGVCKTDAIIFPSFRVLGDSFVAKLTPSSPTLSYSFCLAGRGTTYANGIAVGADGSAYLTGSIRLQNFTPTNFGEGGLLESDDAFVMKLNSAGNLSYFTYLGGRGFESGVNLALDASGNVYVIGQAGLFQQDYREEFPISRNAFQQVFRGGEEVFIAKLGVEERKGNFASVSAASYVGTMLAKESIVTAFGSNLSYATHASPLLTTIAGISVKVKDRVGNERFAPLFFISPNQINYQIPAGTEVGSASVTIYEGESNIASEMIQVTSVAPGVFAANADGQGAAAAVALRIRADGSQSFDPTVQFDNLQKKFITLPIDLGTETDQVFLLLFGTGWRFRSSEAAVKVTIGGVEVPVTYAGLQPTLTGLDQINVRLPRTLAGRGEVDIVVTVDGKIANTVRVSIK